MNESYRHLPHKLYEDVKKYLSDSASTIVFARKNGNSLRLCLEYRKLNLKTIPDKQPIPRAQELLDSFWGGGGGGSAAFFITLDTAKVYHQGYMKEDSRKYIAFSTPWALHGWMRIPFGLKNTPAVLQRYTKSIKSNTN